MSTGTGTPSRANRLAFAAVFWILCLGCVQREGAGPASPAPEYTARISAEVGELRTYEGVTVQVPLRLQNTGTKEWSSDAQHPCRLSYHLLDQTGRVIRFENPRTALPKVVRPGESVAVTMAVKAPLETGRFLVEVDIVREGAAWFGRSGQPTLRLPLTVERKHRAEDDATLGLEYGKYTTFQSSVPELDRLRQWIRITLDQNEVGFQGRTGWVSGFAAGVGYPEIWLRDSATIIPASRFYYPEAFLTSWLEEHLALQQPSGALEDWVDSLGRTGKNTVATDQEASAVLAAHEIHVVKGPRSREWLEKTVAGESILDRLERSILYVLEARRDRKQRLVTRAHTADWGDVDAEDVDDRATDTDERTRWTAGVYDQAMVYGASLELSAMFASVGRVDRAEAWRRRALDLGSEANRLLWQPDKGFYQVHMHLDPFPHAFDEGDMFAMGGNVQAVLSGLAGPRRARSILETALERQVRFGVSTISGVLLPPYPAGFFTHPMLASPWEYQNGGQWDWFGGRLLRAMFEHGFSTTARAKLLEVIRKNVANRGLFEWDTRQGAGRGSDHYAGSAGSLASALFEGYFGFRLSADGLHLAPRLGDDAATVHFYVPTSDRFVAYEYRPDAASRRVVFRVNGNFEGQGEISFLVPWTVLGVPGGNREKGSIAVLKDGKAVPFRWQRLFEDDLVSVRTDFAEHTFELAGRLRP